MIDLPALSDEEIVSLGLLESELYFVRQGEQVWGPYQSKALQHWLRTNSALAGKLEVRRLSEDHWVGPLASPLFAPAAKATAKKKSPAKASVTPLRYFYEQLGHRRGPQTLEQIKDLLAQGKLLSTDLVSSDEGVSWNKIYQLKEFADRAYGAEQMPQAPREHVWQNGDGEALLSLTEDEDPLKASLVSLAYIGQQQKPAALKIDEMPLSDDFTSRPRLSPKWWGALTACATLSIALLVWWAQSPSTLVSDAPVQEAVIEKASRAASPQRRKLRDSGPSRGINSNRAPATYQPRPPSPPAMRDNSASIMQYQELHDRDPRDDVNQEPMDVDPYGADQQYAQDEGQDSLMRRPQSIEAPDDGYRLEEPAANETGPVVEEVGDF